jgi:hypothetical protein
MRNNPRTPPFGGLHSWQPAVSYPTGRISLTCFGAPATLTRFSRTPSRQTVQFSSRPNSSWSSISRPPCRNLDIRLGSCEGITKLIADTIRSQSTPDSRDLMGRTAPRRHLRDYDQSLQSIDTSRHKFSSFYLIGGCHQNASNFIGPQPRISLEKQSGDATHVRSGNRCTG